VSAPADADADAAPLALSAAQGMGAAVDLFQPHEVSGTIVSLLRELLGDVYADVRLTALQQVLPVGRLAEAHQQSSFLLLH
jgi:hypothetical protein